MWSFTFVHNMKAWRNPQNRKYITHHIIVIRMSHSHRQHILKLSWNLVLCFFRYVRGQKNKQTIAETDRQTDTKPHWLQHFAPYREWSTNYKPASSIIITAYRSQSCCFWVRDFNKNAKNKYFLCFFIKMTHPAKCDIFWRGFSRTCEGSLHGGRGKDRRRKRRGKII